MEIQGIQQYAQAQIYSQMYRFTKITLQHGGKEKLAEIINKINLLAVPQETKDFMIAAANDAANQKPKYRNYFSMLNRSNPA